MSRQLSFPSALAVGLLAMPAGLISPATAETVLTNPLGFNKVTCLTNSDTIVGVPFRSNDSLSAALAAPPSVSGDVATLTLAGNPALTADAYANAWYVKFSSGAKDGAFHPITANTANTLTLDLNGDSLDGATTGDTLIIARYWTLDTLFPPDQATTSWTESPEGSGNWVADGHAIVASTSAFPIGRRTEILLPNTTGTGINLSSSGTYYILNGGWRRQGQPVTSDFGSLQLQPDNLFTIRHPSTVTHPTIFRSTGEVDSENVVIPLNTQNSGRQDNFIALIRPINLSLDELQLGGTAAFVSSTSAFPNGRRDELLVFNNEIAARNKSASATYYYLNGAWRKQGQPIADNFGGETIPAGAGFLIRKYQTINGETAFWINPPTY